MAQSNEAKKGIDSGKFDQKYLDQMRNTSGELSEKAQILEYILKDPEGRYLEIGPGGGEAIAEVINGINEYNKACDQEGMSKINPQVTLVDLFMEELKQPILDNNETIKNYHEQGNLDFIQDDARSLDSIPDNSISGINLSAILHECSAYGGGIVGVQKVIESASRILKPNGVMIYRDPEGVELHEYAKSEFNTYESKVFLMMFLPKFLDQKFTKISDKADFYDVNDVFLSFVNKEGRKVRITLHQALSLPLNQIVDMNEDIGLEGDRGLIREIERHFITFTDFASVDSYHSVEDNRINEKGEGETVLSFAKQNGERSFIDFCYSTGITFHKGKGNYTISDKDYQKYKKKSQELFYLINRPLELDLSNEDSEDLEEYLFEKGAYRDAFIDEDGWDISQMMKHWNLIEEFFKERLQLDHFTPDDLPLVQDFPEIRNHLRNIHRWSYREGEEHYFYASPPEFISNVIDSSLTKETNEFGREEWFCICPVQEKVDYVSRDSYTRLLQSHLNISGPKDSLVGIKEGKRIIHFQKIPVQFALPILLEVANTLEVTPSSLGLLESIKAIHEIANETTQTALGDMMEEHKFQNGIAGISKKIEDTLNE
ncbi:class I SAM-dependent methyltransferase [Patescibacteria group bacterium]